MRFTPTVVVEIGAILTVTGVLLLERLDLPTSELHFLQALIAVVLGLFFIQIGYAQSLQAGTRNGGEKRRPPDDAAE